MSTLSFRNSVRRARKRSHRQVLGHKRTFPPAGLTWLGELVAIPIRANKFWRRTGKRVVCKQPKNSLVAFENSLNKRKKPWMQVRRRHGRKPHLPVELPMVRRHNARRPFNITGFSFEFVFAPFSGSIIKFCVSSFNHDLEPLACYGSECAVGVDEMQRLEAGVHQLPTRK